jgi:STE24 endopeptidase
VLNLRHPRGPVPEGLRGFIDEERHERGRRYRNDRGRFGIASASLGFAATLALLLLGGFGWWDGVVDGWIGRQAAFGIPHALVFFGGLILANDLLGLPLELWAVFGIEAKYGFNQTTPATFAADKLKGWLLGSLVGGALLAAFLCMLAWLGAVFWIWFALVAVAFMLAANLLYASLILPLFNKLSPLPEGGLREAIEACARCAGFPLGRILVMDGSKRSTKANAFFSGLGRQKNIVLFDTLVEKHPAEEVVAVLAHEVGHWKRRHTLTGFLLGAAQVTLTLFVLSLLVASPQLSAALGGAGLSVPLNLLAFSLLYAPLSALAGLGLMVLSRRHEYQADAFAAAMGHGPALATALKRLSADSLSDLHPHPWLVFWEYSHPPLLDRLAALEAG